MVVLFATTFNRWNFTVVELLSVGGLTARPDVSLVRLYVVQNRAVEHSSVVAAQWEEANVFTICTTY